MNISLILQSSRRTRSVILERSEESRRIPTSSQGWHGGVAASHKASITPSLQYHPALAGFHRAAISSQSDFTRHRRISLRHSSPTQNCTFSDFFCIRLHFSKKNSRLIAVLAKKVTFYCVWSRKISLGRLQKLHSNRAKISLEVWKNCTRSVQKLHTEIIIEIINK